MTGKTDTHALDAFGARVTRVSLVAAGIALAGVMAASLGYTPLAGGLALGFAASVAGTWLKLRSLRALGADPESAGAGQAAMALLLRLAVYSIALGVASSTEHVAFWPAAGGLLLANAVTVILAAAESRQPAAET